MSKQKTPNTTAPGSTTQTSLPGERSDNPYGPDRIVQYPANRPDGTGEKK